MNWLADKDHATGNLKLKRLAAPFFKARVESLFADCDVHIDGPAATDPRIHDPAFYPRVIAHGSLGLGESYMDQWWDVADLDGFLTRLLAARLDRRVRGLDDLWNALLARIWNRQNRRRAFMIGNRHYDLGNDLYRAMLGSRMVYSCGYWRHSDELDTAQEAKLDLVCRKLGLEPGMRVLDVGCGWGEALHYAAEHYGVHGVGITVSREQVPVAEELCDGLPVEIRLQDYRELDEQFDRIFSIGMFEHVGRRNYRRFMEIMRHCLSPEGLFLLHTIGAETSTTHTDPWIEKYIFPNSMLPSAPQIADAVEDLFVIEDWHNFGADYDRTLIAWRDNVDRAWVHLGRQYDKRFRRLWRYYLSSAAASFRTRRSQLWQIVLSPNGVPGGYVAPR